MTDDKKTDRVISMAEFKEGVEANKEKTKASDYTAEEMMAYALSLGAANAVVVAEDTDGKMMFFSNIDDYQLILFMLECYKKMVMDRTFVDE